MKNSLTEKIERLLEIKPAYENALRKVLSEILEEAVSDLTADEKSAFAEYSRLEELVEQDIFAEAVVVSDNPRVRQYVKDSVANRVREIDQEERQIDIEDEQALLFSWLNTFTYCETYLALNRLFTRYPVPDEIREMVEEARRCYLPRAKQGLLIDLDDGVRESYPKFGAAPAKLMGLTKK